MVTVTTTTGDRQVGAGADYSVIEGILFVTDASGGNVASFAPGVWQSAEVAPS